MTHAERRLRHCMVVHGYYPDPRVEREARALVEAGYAVDVVALRDAGDPPVEEPEPGLVVRRVPLGRRRGRGALAQLGEYVAFLGLALVEVGRLHVTRRYDSVQVHNLPDFLILAALVPRIDGAGLILDLHDLMPEFAASRFGWPIDGRLVRLVRLQERLSCRLADRVVTVSDHWAATLVERGVPAERLFVLMNLPDPALWSVPERDRGVPDGPLRLIYHGTLVERYGVDLAIRAVAVAREDADVRLHVHGWGERLPSLVELARRLGLGDAVEFSTERLPTRGLARLVAGADVGLVPYRRDVFTDGILPTKLMEYALLGMPAIVTRTPAIERLFDESMVRFVPGDDVDALAEAIVELARRPDLRAALGQGIRRFAERHRWEEA
ncbi:MAG TPA: glycosyltransferase family 4 protein, partial [Candidatus Limnocylindrales bacterium]|nr:glycosyltransferase family 4 protein [Candidatus Limnocylindrales bacterium]